MTEDYNREEIGKLMSDLLEVISKTSGKKLSEVLAEMPLIDSRDIKERLAAGMLLVILGNKNSDDDEKVIVSSSILIALLAEIYRWRDMFGSINLLETKRGK